MPKGDGLCTKCPLDLKLRKRDPNGAKDHDYATIRHKDMEEGVVKEIDDLTKVDEAIKKMSDEITKGSNRIVDVPIYLTIYREN